VFFASSSWKSEAYTQVMAARGFESIEKNVMYGGKTGPLNNDY